LWLKKGGLRVIWEEKLNSVYPARRTQGFGGKKGGNTFPGCITHDRLSVIRRRVSPGKGFLGGGGKVRKKSL